MEDDLLSPELERARCRPLSPGKDRDQGRLSGAVFSEEDVHLACPEIKIDVIQRPHSRIILGYGVGRDQHLARYGRGVIGRWRLDAGGNGLLLAYSTMKTGRKPSGARVEDESNAPWLSCVTT